ncbi:MAG: OmpA family protein [Myxococcota bacterium]
MHTTRNLALVALLTAAATGCVGKKKFDALQSQLDTTRAELRTELEASKANATSLSDALDDEKAAAADLGKQIVDLEEKNAELVKDRSKLDASVTEMADALRDLKERKEASDARIAEFQSLLTKFADLIDAGRLTVKIVEGRMVVELASDILFESGKAELSDEGQTSLVDVGKVLAEIEDRYFQVEGHTDNVPIKTDRFPSNWELGAARAITVVRTLHEGGISMERLSAASFADNRPVSSNETKDSRGKNRRIEIVVVPDLSLLPGYEELEQLAKAE